MRIASLSNFSQLGLSVMSYAISPSSSAVNEGSTVTFTITTFGVETGTTLYWTTTGTVTSADFSDNTTTGSVITSGDTTTFNRTIAQDALIEGDETFQIQIRIGSTSGEVVTTSDVITISDRQYTVVPSSSTVTEGTSLSFSVSTVNVSNGTLYWSINNITSEDADFSEVTGSFTLTSGSGTFSITTIADLSTEGDQTFNVSVRVGSTSGTIVANSSTVTITDTSISPLSQALYTTSGTYTWTAPAGVSSVSVICVGGGGGGGSNRGGGGGGGALAYGNDITVVPGTNYTVVVGAGGDTGSPASAGGQSYFSSATFLKAGGGSGGSGGNGNGAGGGGGAGGYSGQGGYAGNSQSATKYSPGIYGTASGTAMTAGFSGGYGGYGGNTVTSFSAAAISSSGGSGGGGRGTNGGTGQDGGGVGLLGEGASGANPIASSGSGNPNPFVVNGGSGGNDGSTSTASGDFGGGGGGSSAGAGGAVRIIWPGNERQFPSTRVDDEPSPDGAFTFTSVPTTMAYNTTKNFTLTVSGSPQLTLYWTIKHGTTSSDDFTATSGSFTKLATNNISLTTTLTNSSEDRTFQLEIRVGSTSGTVVATSSVVSLLVTGQQLYTTSGTYTFTVPTDVTSLSVVCVGGGGGGGSTAAGGAGGGLGYKNNITVSPGQQFTVVVGAGGVLNTSNGGDSYFNTTSVVAGYGGTRGYTTSPVPAGGGYTGDGGGNGGNAGLTGSDNWGSGGGAGGYAGKGGNGGGGTPVSGSGGGGGGRAGSNVTAYGGAGGGVGLYGKGTDGDTSIYSTYSGGGGSGGQPTTATQYGYGPYNYGAGGGGAASGTGLGRGGSGAVRIVWPGVVRQFPTTDVGDF